MTSSLTPLKYAASTAVVSFLTGWFVSDGTAVVAFWCFGGGWYAGLVFGSVREQEREKWAEPRIHHWKQGWTMENKPSVKDTLPELGEGAKWWGSEVIAIQIYVTKGQQRWVSMPLGILPQHVRNFYFTCVEQGNDPTESNVIPGTAWTQDLFRAWRDWLIDMGWAERKGDYVTAGWELCGRTGCNAIKEIYRRLTPALTRGKA